MTNEWNSYGAKKPLYRYVIDAWTFITVNWKKYVNAKQIKILASRREREREKQHGAHEKANKQKEQRTKKNKQTVDWIEMCERETREWARLALQALKTFFPNWIIGISN